jgi:hypothetical protein
LEELLGSITKAETGPPHGPWVSHLYISGVGVGEEDGVGDKKEAGVNEGVRVDGTNPVDFGEEVAFG